MMGRYTTRAYGGRLIARISTERHDYALVCSVSSINEYEKRGTESLLHFHIQFQSPAFIHRQTHIRRFHANRKVAT